MGIPLYFIYYFSPAGFHICSLCLIFVSLINMSLGMFHLGFILFGTLWYSWNCVTNSFPILGKISTIISSKIFSFFFLLYSPSGMSIIQMLSCSTLSQRALRLSSFLFTLFCSASFISTILSSSSHILYSASVPLPLVPSRVFLISFIAFFIID